MVGYNCAIPWGSYVLFKLENSNGSSHELKKTIYILLASGASQDALLSTQWRRRLVRRVVFLFRTIILGGSDTWDPHDTIPNKFYEVDSMERLGPNLVFILDGLVFFLCYLDADRWMDGWMDGCLSPALDLQSFSRQRARTNVDAASL